MMNRLTVLCVLGLLTSVLALWQTPIALATSHQEQDTLCSHTLLRQVEHANVALERLEGLSSLQVQLWASTDLRQPTPYCGQEEARAIFTPPVSSQPATMCVLLDARWIPVVTPLHKICVSTTQTRGNGPVLLHTPLETFDAAAAGASVSFAPSQDQLGARTLTFPTL